MELSREEMEKISRLARIELDDTEIEKYRHEMSDVLNYVAQLNEVDTEGVSPIAHVTGMVNELRDDVVMPDADPKRFIDAAPEKTDDKIKVKKVL
jgi:aspartyl-tRNA(Asn)/glutamyl-tRNA(Gln) amidotransferase subunit C